MHEKWIALSGLIVTGLLASRVALLAGPFAPAAGEPGSTAIPRDSELFVAWATGWTDYFVGAECSTNWQHPDQALGIADSAPQVHNIVSLGQGGEITLTFDLPIADGPGPDFAVFENALTDFFLELAQVEVSSDGTHFFRMENESLTPEEVPFWGGGIDPTDVRGFAGKYRVGYGTPFDLSELSGVSPLLDLSNVRWVRLQDVIGDGTYVDSFDNVVYDPYPTVDSAGFDLDAVGVINFPTRLGAWFQGEELHLSYDARTNRVYRIQWADDLLHGNWQDLGHLVEGNNSIQTMVQSRPDQPAIYYRVIKTLSNQ